MFALTHRSDHDVSDPGITLLSGGVTEAVATTLAAADGKNIGIFGANTAQQCLAAGLVDELFIDLAPSCSATASGCTAATAPDGSTWNRSASPSPGS